MIGVDGVDRGEVVGDVEDAIGNCGRGEAGFYAVLTPDFFWRMSHVSAGGVDAGDSAQSRRIKIIEVGAAEDSRAIDDEGGVHAALGGVEMKLFFAGTGYAGVDAAVAGGLAE